MTVTQEMLQEFVAGCQQILTVYYTKHFSNLPVPVLSVMSGHRYTRVVRKDYPNAEGRSAFCFVDMTNGDVLKVAGWKAPAKHARGNLTDEHKGLSWITPHGPQYL